MAHPEQQQTDQTAEILTPDTPASAGPNGNGSVSADDYGRDPVAGEIVFSNRHEIAILRNAPEVGDVVVHFPRAGFTVAMA